MASKFKPKFTSAPNYSFSNPAVKRVQASSGQTSSASSVPIENQVNQMTSHQIETNNNLVNSGLNRTVSSDNLQNANKEVNSRIARITRMQSPTLPRPNYRINVSRKSFSFGRTSNLNDINKNLRNCYYFNDSSEDDKLDFEALNDYKHETNSIHYDIVLFVAFFAFIFIFYLLNQKREA